MMSTENYKETNSACFFYHLHDHDKQRQKTHPSNKVDFSGLDGLSNTSVWSDLANN